jgi:hypothetical protein
MYFISIRAGKIFTKFVGTEGKMFTMQCRKKNVYKLTKEGEDQFYSIKLY